MGGLCTLKFAPITNFIVRRSIGEWRAIMEREANYLIPRGFQQAAVPRECALGQIDSNPDAVPGELRVTL
ncbi:hypothetical protein J2W46_005722 [Paraburkholderia strydomiana]|nr:hypothetical protein [Paraburkholderia strydomiana]